MRYSVKLNALPKSNENILTNLLPSSSHLSQVYWHLIRAMKKLCPVLGANWSESTENSTATATGTGSHCGPDSETGTILTFSNGGGTITGSGMGIGLVLVLVLRLPQVMICVLVLELVLIVALTLTGTWIGTATSTDKRTWGDREGHWGRWLWYVTVTKVIFSFRKSVFRNVRTDYNLDLRFLVKSKKQISMVIADLSWGQINIFRGDTRGLCFSWYTRCFCSQGTQRTNKSSFVFVCVTIQSWLWLTVCKWCKIQEIHVFQLNKIYFHTRHYLTSSNCIFMQLQGLVFIQLQGNDILLNCQGNIDSFNEHIFVHKKYNHSRQLYSDTKLYSFQGTVSVRSKKYILVQWNIFNQGNYKGHMFIQGNYIYIYISLSVSFLLPSCEEIPPESLPASDTISSPKSDVPASEPFISKRNYWTFLKLWVLAQDISLSFFWKSLSSIKLTYTQTLSLRFTH